MAKTGEATKSAGKPASNGVKATTDSATESDKIAETAMNATPETTEPLAETPVTTEGSTDEIGETEEGIAADGSVKLPPNEFNFLTEVLKTPISKERYDELVASKNIEEGVPMDTFYEVTAEVPGIVFGDKASKKTLAQSAKTKLAERGVIKIVIAGNPSKKSVIQLLNDKFSIGKNGRATGKRRGRPPGVKTATATTATIIPATPGKRGRKSNAERAAMENESGETFAALRARLMPDPARIEKFIADLHTLNRKYPDLVAAAGIDIK